MIYFSDKLLSFSQLSGSGGAGSNSFNDLTDLPAIIRRVTTPLPPVPANFQNAYLGGVTYDQTANTLTSTGNGWGSAGAWDDTAITGDGSISAVLSTTGQSEQMFGLSYKNSENDAQSITFSLIDYAWYFRVSDSKAFIREANADGLSSHNVTQYTALAYNTTSVYSIKRTGTVITYLIDDVVVFTSLIAATTNDMYFDVAFSKNGSSFSNMLVDRLLTETITTIRHEDLTGNPIIPDPAVEVENKFLPTLSVPDFQNSYIGGVTYDQTENTITSTVAGWGNSGAWQDTPITGNGAIYAKISTNVTPEQMFGLSYKRSEADAQSLHYDLIDYAWYFRSTDGLAYVREANSNGLTNSNVSAYTPTSYNETDTYGIARNGTTITYLINGVVVYTSSVTSTDESLYFDVAFNDTGNSINSMMVYFGVGKTIANLDFKDLTNAPQNATQNDIDSRDGTDIKLFTPTQISTISSAVSTGVATSLISQIPAPSVGVENTFIPFLSPPNFQNAYLGGVTYDQTANTLTSTANGWGSAGAWHDTAITGNGIISAVLSTTGGSEQMFGLSYKNSENDAQSLTFSLIDYAWYFRDYDKKAFIREANADGLASHTVTQYTALAYNTTSVYSIKRTGTVITYLIDDVVVFTSLIAATTDNMYFDVAFSKSGSSLSDMMIGHGDGGDRTIAKLDYTEINNAPVDTTNLFEGIIKNLDSTDFTKTYNSDNTIATIVNNGNVTQTFTYTTIDGKSLVSKILLSGDGLPPELVNNAKNFLYNAAGLETSVTYTPT